MDFEAPPTRQNKKESDLSAQDHLDRIEALMQEFPASLQERLEAELDEIDLNDPDQLQNFHEYTRRKLDSRRDALSQKFTGHGDGETLFENNLPPELKERTQEEIYHLAKELKKNNYEKLGYGKTADVKAKDFDFPVCYKYITNPDEYKKGNNIGEEMQIQDKCLHIRPDGNDCRVPRPLYSYMDNYCHFCVMENVRGYTLQEILNGKGEILDNFDIDKFFSDLEHFVREMHKNNIYHRDLHDRNIMVECEGGKPVIIDFGKAVNLKNTGYTENPYRDEKNQEVLSDDLENVKGLKQQLKNFLSNK